MARAGYYPARFMASDRVLSDLLTALEPEGRGGSGTGVPPVRFETNGRDARATSRFMARPNFLRAQSPWPRAVQARWLRQNPAD
jgi:hypothetical protein